MRATHPPVIVLTSNRTRDLHDAVKRRCLYHWIDYPSPEREVEIVRRRVKGASEALAVQVAGAVARMRDSDVQKPPGVAEAIDWLAALELLGVETLDAAAVERTLGSVLKYSEDQEVVRAAGLEQLVLTEPFRVETIHLDLPALGGRVQPAAARGRPAGDGRARGAVRARAGRSSGRCRGGGCTGRRGRRSSPTRRRSRRSTGCSSRCSVRASRRPSRTRITSSRRASAPTKDRTRSSPGSPGPRARLGDSADPARRTRPTTRCPCRRRPATRRCCAGSASTRSTPPSSPGCTG